MIFRKITKFNKAVGASITLLLTSLAIQAQPTNVSYSDVVGYVKIDLPAGADTIIAPQVLRPAELSVPVTGVTSSAGQATLTIGGTSMINNQFQFNNGSQPNTYFALVTGGNLAGTYFSVVSNTTSAITVSLDGLTAVSADITNIEIRPCWSLNTLFPASDAGVSFTPSASQTAGTRRTTILFPDNTGSGVNRSASATYFFNDSVGVKDWVSTAATSVKAGNTPIFPGSYVIHRNTGGTPTPLSLTHSGGVFARSLSLYLGTATNGANDTYVALPRPTDYTLSQLGLSTNAFTPSVSITAGGRRDQLLVVSPSGTGINRSASATYFLVGTNWYSTANTATPTNNAVIPSGSALIIRKVLSDGNDRVWANSLNTSL